MIRQAVILAAGRGKRLGRLTEDRPKSMLPVLGKPIVGHVVDQLYAAGIRRFVVVVGTDERAITGYLNQSPYPDAELYFVVQAEPTGTVDALQLAVPHLDGPFLLTAVDNLTAPAHVANLIARFDAHPDHLAVVSLLTAPPEDIRKSSGVVLQNGRVTEIVEKPDRPRTSWLSFMLYAFAPHYLDYLPGVRVSSRGERELVSAIQAGIAGGCRVGYAVADWRLHLTRELDLLAINRQLLHDTPESRILSEIPASAQVTPPVHIDPGVLVGPDAQIGPHVYLESGASVGAGAVLRDAVILRGAAVAPQDRCENEIISQGVRLSSGAAPHPIA